MEKGEITARVNKDAYPSGEVVIKAYLPYPGLAIHRLIPDNPIDARRATRWRRWVITHVNSGLRVNGDYFKCLRDALLACRMIADMLPWTLSKDEIISYSGDKLSTVKMIVHYAEQGYDETQIATLVMESELERG
jgi:hypothetical protein